MVKLLIENGADPKKSDYGGTSSLDVINVIQITPGIRNFMYKILSQNVVNLCRKRQKQHLSAPITSGKKQRKN